MEKPDVTYDFYFNTYSCGGDGIIPRQEFDRIAGAAGREVLQSITCDGDYPEFEAEVKLCTCEVADLLYEAKGREGIKSENIDGYSVTFEGGNRHRQIREIIRRRLGNTGMLYSGVEECTSA